MSDGSRADQRKGGVDAACVVPSVKDILDGVAAEAGLSTFDDDTFRSVDEDEAARDVARAMSKVRPLLQRYELRYEELAAQLSRAQASAASATREARARSQAHLWTFDRLGEGCAVLRRDLAAAAAATAVTAHVPTDDSSPDHHERGDGGSSGGDGSAGRRAAAAAEADALAARHRSLVQRRRRTRSALHVMEATEQARAALEAAEEAGLRGVHTERATESIERLRSFLGDSRTHTTRGSSSSSSVGSGAKGSAKTETLVGAAAAAAVPRAGGGETETAEEDGGVGVGVSSGLADGELVKVARGRLDWLTRRLRDGLYSELATALSEADPLSSGGRVGGGGGGVGKAKGKGEGESKGGDVISAEDEERRREGVARIKEAMGRLFHLQFGCQRHSRSALPDGKGRDDAESFGTGGGAGGGAGGALGAQERAGAVWALDGLFEPVAVRFQYHFEEDKPTNRIDRPEWFLSFLLRALEAYRPLLEIDDAQPLLGINANGSASSAGGVDGDGGSVRARAARGVGGVDCVAYFARGLALLARRRLRAQLGAAAADGALLSHTVEEALAFDRQLDREAGYALCPVRFPGQAWPRCVEVFAQDEQRFERWMESDAAAARGKLEDAVEARGAWRAVVWKNGPRPTPPVTPSAVAVCRIFAEITERYRPLRDPLKQLRFARRVQEPLLRSYRDSLYWRGNDCRLASVFRDQGDESDGITARWTAALGAVLGPGQDEEEEEDATPIGRWRGYCLAISSCAYVLGVLRDSENDLFLADMGERAKVAAAAAAAKVGDGVGASSLGAVGNAVGAAVGGVSQAVTSVATTAETATAGVVRAVGAHGTIIGPTHAISAALTSLKGAARRVRKASNNTNTTANTNANTTAAAASSDSNGNDNGSDENGNEMVAEAVVRPEGSGDAPVGAEAATDGVGHAKDQDWEGSVNAEGSGVAAPNGSGDGGGSRSAGADAAWKPDAGGGGGGGGFPAGVGEVCGGSVFGEEARQYDVMLAAMMRAAVESCRDGFLWRSRSYVRAWDRDVAVVVPIAVASAASAALTASTAAAAAAAAVPGIPAKQSALGLGSGSGSDFSAEASGRLGAGVGLLSTAVGQAETSLPSAQFREFWTALAGELDAALAEQVVARRPEISQDEGLQLRADVKALMAPFDVVARRRPERHFPALTEAAILLSLEKSQLRSLSSGLAAHGGSVMDAGKGAGWSGWREEGGSLSPEGTQMRDMLENIGVRRLGPAEASLLLDKRIKGDRRAVLGHLSIAAGAGPAASSTASVEGGGDGGSGSGTSSQPLPSDVRTRISAQGGNGGGNGSRASGFAGGRGGAPAAAGAATIFSFA